jgi:hypothetical protein
MSIIDQKEYIKKVLSSNVYSCSVCNKKYSRKHSLDKHKILCEFNYQSIRERNIVNEEIEDIPSFLELVKIVQELHIKNSKMEEKITNMQKWVDKKKQKIDILNWLDVNVTPTLSFNDWVCSNIIRESDYIYLLENTIYQTVQQILIYNLTLSNTVYPIMCFSEKVGNFYIYDNNVWRHYDNDDFFKLLRKIRNELIDIITAWQLTNENELSSNDRLSNQFNKSIIKLMDISITENNNFGKFKSGLYNYLKKDMKCIIEYEYEF